MKKGLLVFVVLLVFGTFFYFTSNEDKDEKIIKTIEIKDMTGRIVNIPENIEKIICRGPGMLRVVSYLNATDKVAALESGFEKDSKSGRPYRIAKSDLDDLPLVGAAGPVPNINPEVILNINPEVIFLSSGDPKTADDLQNKIGIPVIALISNVSPTSFSDEMLYTSLRIMGKVLHKEERAEAVIQYIDNIEDDLRNRTKFIQENKIPTVYAGGLGYRGTQGLTSTQSDYAAFNVLGIKNVVDELEKKGSMFVDKEKILEWDPEIIFVDSFGFDKVLTEYKKQPEFYSYLKAFKTNNIYSLFPYKFYSANYGTAMANAYFIGKTIFPNEFSDIDPEKKADEFYEFLLGKPVFLQMKKDWKGFNILNLQGLD